MRILEQWQDEVRVWWSGELFYRLFSLFWMLNMIRLLPIGNQVWGSEAPIILNIWYEGFDQLTMLLNIPAIREVYLIPVIAFIILCGFNIVGRHHWLSRMLAWLLFANLHQANPEISNGGYHLSQQLFFFATFFVGHKHALQRNAFRNLVHNLAFYAIWANVAFMYVVASMQKLSGDMWVSGEAVAVVLSLEEYSLPLIQEGMTGNNFLLQLLTWGSLAYQLLFPILVWVRRVRSYLLLAGIGFHAFIAIGVGIFDFGIALMVIYSIFVSDDRARVMLMRLPSWLVSGKAQEQGSLAE